MMTNENPVPAGELEDLDRRPSDKDRFRHLDIVNVLRRLELAAPRDTASPLPRVRPNSFLVGGAILALAREVRLLREEVALVHGVMDDCGTALEKSIDHLADVTEGS